MKRLVSLLIVAGVLFLFSAPISGADKYWVFLGTYTGKNSKGIYRAQFDAKTGTLSAPELAAETPNPTFLAIHPSGKFLYAVNEVGTFRGKKGGGITAYALDAKTGQLKELNQQSSVGSGPCHVFVDAAGKNVLFANYGGGSCGAYPLGADGKIAEKGSFHQHQGSSVNKARQGEPHAHSINLDKTNKFAIVADLGLDKLLVYKFDGATGTLTPHEPAFFATTPGSGPRHFSFHPNGKYAFVNGELDSTVTALKYDADKGVFTKINTLSTLPAPTKGNSTAEVIVHPNGKFVYVSNRGHNSIAIFKVNEQTGELTAAGHQGKGIQIPRNFAIDPTGGWMLVGNQAGNSVIVFKVNGETGALEPTETKIEVGSPVCIRYLAVTP